MNDTHKVTPKMNESYHTQRKIIICPMLLRVDFCPSILRNTGERKKLMCAVRQLTEQVTYKVAFIGWRLCLS